MSETGGKGRNRNGSILYSCFLCLEGILPPSTPPAKWEPGGESLPVPTSLKYLSRFLRLGNIRKQLDGDNDHLVDPTILKDITVECCTKCNILITTFTDKYRQLEKIEMEVMSILKVINDILHTANKLGKVPKFDNLVTGYPPSGKFQNQINIVEVLRKETVDKCSHIIKSAQPRVKVNQLKLEEANALKRKIGNSSNVAQKWESPKSDNDDDVSTKALLGREVKIEPPFKIPKSEDEDLTSYCNYSDSEDVNEHNMKQIEDTVDIPYVKQLPEGKRPREVKTGTSTSSSTILRVRVNKSKPVGPKFTVNPQTRKIKCSICSLEYTTKHIFRQHYKINHTRLRHKCQLCGKIFRQIQHYNRHYREAHIGVKYSCQVCGKRFSQDWNLKRHVKKIHFKSRE